MWMDNAEQKYTLLREYSGSEQLNAWDAYAADLSHGAVDERERHYIVKSKGGACGTRRDVLLVSRIALTLYSAHSSGMYAKSTIQSPCKLGNAVRITCENNTVRCTCLHWCYLYNGEQNTGAWSRI